MTWGEHRALGGVWRIWRSAFSCELGSIHSIMYVGVILGRVEILTVLILPSSSFLELVVTVELGPAIGFLLLLPVHMRMPGNVLLMPKVSVCLFICDTGACNVRASTSYMLALRPFTRDPNARWVPTPAASEGIYSQPLVPPSDARGAPCAPWHPRRPLLISWPGATDEGR